MIKAEYTPRPWQVRAHLGLHDKRNGLLICSRQIGKTIAALNHLHDLCINGPPNCNSIYICPTQSQARRIAWPALLEIVAPYGDHAKIMKSQMTITLPGNRVIYILGAEQGESLRGMSARHCVCDERDNISDSFWRTVMLPVFNEYQEEARIIYIGTLSGGDSRLYRMYLANKDNPEWFCLIVNGVDANVFSEAHLDYLRQEMGEIAFQREIMCNPHASVENAVLGAEVTSAINEGRVCRVPYRPGYQVFTCWDLGISDATTMWAFMIVGRTIEWLAYQEWSGPSTLDIIGDVTNRYPTWRWGEAILPHDSKAREKGSGLSVKALFQRHWPGYVYYFEYAPSPTMTVQSTRNNMVRSYFDEVNCDQGLLRLKSAAYEVTAKTEMVTDRIKHDWNSHGLDAFRTGNYRVADMYSDGPAHETEIITSVGSLDGY